jgi:hypothetical protein
VDPPGISTKGIVSEGYSLVDPYESYVAIQLKLSDVWLLKVLRNLAKVYEPFGQHNKWPLTLRGPYDMLLLPGHDTSKPIPSGVAKKGFPQSGVANAHDPRINGSGVVSLKIGKVANDLHQRTIV